MSAALESWIHSSSLVTRLLLAVGEKLYGVGYRFDRWRNERRAPLRLPVPVISIGNITVGGAGKTPLVEAVVCAALLRSRRVGILSRGYKGGADGNDEYRMLAKRLPQVPHRQGADRHAAGRALLGEHPDLDALILDDGFQHRRLARDVDVVVLDATRPFGFGHLLPRGTLREPWTALERATDFVITRTEQVSDDKLAILECFLRDYFPGRSLSRARFVAEGWYDRDGERVELTDRDRVFAFAGIGNPEAFFRSLAAHGPAIAGSRRFPDHYRYRDADLATLDRAARVADATGLVCTEKDAIKVMAYNSPGKDRLPVYEWRMRWDVDVEAIWNRVFGVE